MRARLSRPALANEALRALTHAGLSAAIALGVSAQTEAPLTPEQEEPVVTAPDPVVSRMLATHRDAQGTGDALEIAKSLAAMSGYDNVEFKAPALAALKYKASRFDRRAAKDLGEDLGASKKEIAALLFEREGAVQAAAAVILANHGEDKEVLARLTKLYKDKKLINEKPAVLAAVVESLGKLSHDRIEKDVIRLLDKAKTKEVAQACVRYLGHLPAKSYHGARRLCEMLSPPEPSAVNDPNNPPASYWKSQWDRWDWTRRDVSWALKQITGQVFRPAEGDHPSDYDKAIAYIKEHKQELGLE